MTPEQHAQIVLLLSKTHVYCPYSSDADIALSYIDEIDSFFEGIDMKTKEKHVFQFSDINLDKDRFYQYIQINVKELCNG